MALCFEELVDLPKANDAWQRAIKGNDKVADWHYRRGKLLDRQGDAKSALVELEIAIEQGEKRDNRPGWMADAHFLVAETYRPTAKEKAIYHFQEFLRLAPPDNAYRVDATRALEELKP
jgi:tetratricopeptide (TPR) repeat protein